MTIEAHQGDGQLATRRAFGDDVRTGAPASVAVFGARPPSLLASLMVRLAKLLAGKGRAPKTPKSETPIGAPDPEKLFPAPRYDAEGAAIEGGLGAQYDAIGKQLRDEAEALDNAAAAEAAEIGHSLAASLLDQMEANAVFNMAAIIRSVILLGVVVFTAAFSWRIASQLTPAPYSYGLLYLMIGLFGVLAAGVAADSAAAEARKRFARASGKLEALVGKASHMFRDLLVEQRAAMQLNSSADLSAAIAAAARARLTTVAALRFYQAAPIIGVEADGYRCHILAHALSDVASQRLGAGRRLLGQLSGVIFGAAIGIIALYVSLAHPIALLPPPAFIGEFLAAEMTRPGIVSFALAIAAAVLAPHLFGPFAAQVVAAADAAGALSREPARGQANGLQARALTAAAEQPREMIERFADALIALERRAEAWSKTGARFGADASAEASGALAGDLAWRKAPEGPRFVTQTFAAAPPAFVAGAPEPARRGLFSQSVRPDAVPKQSFKAGEAPPWLKN
ncbi:MAG: hypothetical protein ACKVS5_08050 [Parvularculaceae bacterium]